MTGRRWLSGLGLLLLAGVTLLLPLLLGSGGIPLYVTIGLSTMVVIGLSLLMGFAGQISLGQAVFFAIGAYTAALLSLHGLPSLVGLLAAPLVTAVVAALIGIPLLQLRGHALAFGSLAVQLIVLSLIPLAPSLTGGAIGLSGIPALGLGPVQLPADGLGYAYLVWGLVALLLLLTHNLVRSRPGRALRAMATSPTGAAAVGVPVVRYRIQVFALSAAYAGLAGGVYAFFIGYISPDAFPVVLSIQFLVMAVVGGLGSLWGPLVGAVGVSLLAQGLSTLGSAPGMPATAPIILSLGVYAVILILTQLFIPRGVVPSLVSWGHRLRWQRRAQGGV